MRESALVGEQLDRLGATNMRSTVEELILWPVRNGPDLVGVAVVGVSEAPLASRLEVLELLCASAAAPLRARERHEQLQRTLLLTQEQEDSLRQKGSDLSDLNLELAAKSKRLVHSEQELRAQRTELEDTNIQLHRQAADLLDKSHRLDLRNREVTAINEELGRKAQELERSNRYKTEFLANVSHELRTPLNSLLMLSQLLLDNRDDNLEEHQLKWVEVMLRSGHNLKAIIDNLLELTAFHAGDLPITPADVSPKRLVTLVDEGHASRAAAKNLAFKVQVGPHLPDPIHIDPQRCLQVLGAIIDNAIKFTSDGRIDVQIGASMPSQLACARSDSNEVLELGLGKACSSYPRERM